MYNELSKLLCNQVQIFFEIPDSSFQIPVSSFRFQLLVFPQSTHVYSPLYNTNLLIGPRVTCGQRSLISPELLTLGLCRSLLVYAVHVSVACT